MHNCFHAADILIPQGISMKKWACVACDQFSSQPEYWDRVSDFVGDAPSTLHMIIPEAYLRRDGAAERLPKIHGAMEQYLAQGLFKVCRRSFVYLERTMQSGAVRRGLVGQVDLEDYDFTPGCGARIRATEGTVLERIPPRQRLLEGAKLECPHVLLLCDDRKDAILTAAKEARSEKLYDFDLMEDGGHITGWAVSGLGVGLVNGAVSDYIQAVTAEQGAANAMAFAVGDGNHSLAAAKACWEDLKKSLSGDDLLHHPARYALVELENIHDPAIAFEPIHRVLSGVDPGDFLSALDGISVRDGYPIAAVTSEGEKTVYLSREESPLAIAILQPFLDRYTAEQGGAMDYIHGEDVVRDLARKPDAVGLILPGMEKSSLFPGVLQGGVLPRKTFSMGEAREKRYYLEGKRRQ